MDPRPTLDVLNLESPETLRKQRRVALKKAMDPAGSTASRVLTKYRAKQTKLLGEPDVDPYPYSSTYIFYCLDSPPKE